MHVKDAFSGRFIVAFNEDGSVSRFGSGTPIKTNESIEFDDLKNIRQIVTGKRSNYGSSYDFYAIDSEGSASRFCWNWLGYCGDSSELGLTEVKTFVTGRYTYAALKEDGSLQSWGWGADSAWKSTSEYSNDTKLKLLSDNGETNDMTPMIVANGFRTGHSEDYFAAFAALRKNGEVITWGSGATGGDPRATDLTNVESLYATSDSFAAKKNDGSVVIWGETGTVVADKVKTLVANNSYYAAIKTDGTVGYWNGDGEDSIEDLNSYDYDDEGNEIVTTPSLTGVKEIIAGKYSFTALKEDGSVYVLDRWSDDADPGFTNIIEVFQPQGDTYAGLDADGNLRIWGDLDYVGENPEDELAPTLIELSSTIN